MAYKRKCHRRDTYSGCRKVGVRPSDTRQPHRGKAPSIIIHLLLWLSGGVDKADPSSKSCRVAIGALVRAGGVLSVGVEVAKCEWRYSKNGGIKSFVGARRVLMPRQCAVRALEVPRAHVLPRNGGRQSAIL